MGFNATSATFILDQTLMKNVFLHGLKSYINSVCLREARKSSEHIPPRAAVPNTAPSINKGRGRVASINLYLIMFIKCRFRREYR